MRVRAPGALDASTLLELLPAAVPAFRDGRLDAIDATAERIDVHKNRIASVAFTLRIRSRESGAVETRPAFLLPGPVRLMPGSGPHPFGPAADLVGGLPESGPWAVVSPADPALPSPFAILEDDASRWRVELLAHRYGRRATFRLTRADRQSGPEMRLILKCTAGRTSRRASAFLRRLAPGPRAFRMPRVVFDDASRGALVLEYLPGRSLHDAMVDGRAFPMRALGEALASLEGQVPEGLPRYRTEDEFATVRKLAARAAVIDPELPVAIEAALPPIAHFPGHEPLALCHRDLHDKQILAEGAALSVIDWDSACLAPAPLDAGNLLAHLRLRTLQGVLCETAANALREEFLQGLGGAPLDPLSLRRWEALALLRLAAVYTLRPRWNHLGHELLDAATAWKEAA